MKKLSLGDHPGVADSINTIGNVSVKIDDYESAGEQFQNAGALYEKLLDKHAGSANSYHNLAATYLEWKATEKLLNGLSRLRPA